MDPGEAPPAEPAASQQQQKELPQQRGYAIQVLQLSCGRMLAFACMGAPLAAARLACLYHHGVPASLVEAEPLAAAGAALGVAVVAFDRPGMGGSSPDPLLSLASVAADAAALLDHLGLPAAVQVGESGGAPYAAACAALHPGRTLQLVLLAGLGPVHGDEHAALRACLGGMDRRCLGPRGLAAGLVIQSCVRAVAALAPGAVKRGAGRSLGPADAAFLRDSPLAERYKDWLLRFLKRAYRGGVRGVLRDYRVLAGPWALSQDLDAVQARAVAWHGSDDTLVPPCHAEFYHSVLPRCELRLARGEGHISLVGRRGGDILADVAAWAEAHGQLREAAVRRPQAAVLLEDWLLPCADHSL